MLKDEPIFEWDALKDLDNRLKHGVSFREARHAFNDPNCVVEEDPEHSHVEGRLYCYGLDEAGKGVLTVRLLFGLAIFGLLEQGIGAKAGKFMSKKIKYTEGPMGDYTLNDFKRVDKSFLSSPEEIARSMDKIKITITLTGDSIEFFKKQAEKHDIQYQRLIRSILDEYVAHHIQLEKSERKAKNPE